jgi:two-component system chemotaxis sensor kinase CheA
LILEAVDAVRSILRSVEETGDEGPDLFEQLRSRLEDAADGHLPAAVEGQRAPAGDTGAASTPRAKEPPGAENRPASEPESAVSRTVQAAPKDSESPADHEKPPAAADTAIRVDVGLLDKLMNLVGELVLARNQILQFNNQRDDASLNATSQRLNLITTELQEGVMKTRMQPIGVVWNKLPRLVRDVSSLLGKQVRLEMDGAETELDKTIIEAIKDPLTHLVRNACDHGLERPEERVTKGKLAQGVVSLRAYHEGGQVNIEISDDGAGIDVERLKQKALEKGLCAAEHLSRMPAREALNLIFLPGFSTAKTVSNVSGRGVGMDVVKSNIEKIGGVVDVATRPGEGTTVKLKIPLTLAIIPGLVVTSGAERFVIPQVSLLELIRLEGTAAGRIERVHGTPVYRRRGALLPIAYLSDTLGLRAAPAQGQPHTPPEQGVHSDAVNIVVLQAEDRQFGLVVDGINDTQEIVVKPLGKQLKGLTIYAGATIMGDGRVALILDVLGIGQCSGVLAQRREAERADSQKKGTTGEDYQRLLLFRAGSFERLAVPLTLVSRLEEVPQSSIERAGSKHVIQYRGGILPLVPLANVLEPGSDPAALRQDPAQIVVFQDGERAVGLVVDQILDIVEDAVCARQSSERKGLLGSAVVGKKIADFLDLKAVMKAAFGEWEARPASRQRLSVLLAEPSAFVRGLLRAELEMAGYRVLEASSVAKTLAELECSAVDLIAAAVDLPPGGVSELVAAVRRRPASARIPILALAADGATAAPEHFDDCQSKFDRVAMLKSIERLHAAVGHPAVPEEVAR